MSERGVFAVDRGIWDHPMLQSHGPFSRREAWLWLLSSATWKAKTVRIDGRRVTLDRGQLAFSIRFLAEQWGWSKSAVSRFLNALQTETMIGTDGSSGITIITICKYDEYQRVSLPDRDASRDKTGTIAGQQRDKEEHKENKEEDVDDGGTRELLLTEAQNVAKELAGIAGLDPEFWPPGWCGSAMRIQAWLNAGWRRDEILAGAKAAMARKRDGPPSSVNYFEKPILKLRAQQAAPLPTVVVDNTTEVVHVQAAKRDNRDPFREALEQIREYAAESRGGDGQVVRLLPSARG